MKVFIALSALVAVAVALPANPAPYAPRPASYGPSHNAYKELPPQPFQYQYGVSDQYTGTNFEKTESQNDYGVVEGSYRVNLPDGRIQTVTYHADHDGGFIADVSYSGTPAYPPAPKGGYGHAPVHPVHA